MKCFENYRSATQRHKVHKCRWTDGADRSARHGVATNLHVVTSTASATRDKVNGRKTRYACKVL